MKPLNKKLLRDLAANWSQVAAIVIVIALGIIMFAGPLLAQRDLRDSINDIHRRTHYEDFSVKVNTPAPVGTTGQVRRLDNMRQAEGRVTGDLQGKVRRAEVTMRVISVPDDRRPTVNSLLVESGRYFRPDQTGVCLAEHHLASELGVKAGDTVTLRRDGRVFTLRVTGTVVSPEYLRLVESRAAYVSDPAQFGVVFVPYTDVGRIFNMEGRVNEFVCRVVDRRETEATMKAAESLLGPTYGVLALTSAANEPGTETLDFEISDIGKLAMFFAVLLLGVAALALYITMTQIVFSQQRQIGVTRAVGYERGPIMKHYLGYGAVLGLTGGLLGVVCGYYLSRLFIHIYADIFDLPLIKVSLYPLIALAGIGVGMVFSIAGAVVPARHAVRMKPAEAMRTEAGLALGVARHHRGPGITDRLGFPSWLRVSLRNLLRNRRRTVLTCLGVIATLGLLVTATGGKDSIDYAVQKYLHGVLQWDVAAVWSGPVGGEMLKRVKSLEGVTAAEPMMVAPARLVAGERSVDVQVQAFKEDTVMHGDYPTGGSRARPGPDEIVLNRSITKKLPLKLGDDVTVSTRVDTGSGDILVSRTFKVAGFVSEPFGGVCYVNLAFIQNAVAMVTGVPGQFNGVAVKVEQHHADRVSRRLRRIPGVYRVATKSRILKVFQDLVSALKTLFFIFYIMAFAMGFAVLFSMITVNLLERRREIATMRTLGGGKGRIFAFLTVETVSVVIAGLIPGIVLGRVLEWLVVELVSSERLAPDTVISGVTVAVIIMASLAVMILSELPSIKKLWRLDLAKVTKERAD